MGERPYVSLCKNSAWSSRVVIALKRRLSSNLSAFLPNDYSLYPMFSDISLQALLILLAMDGILLG